MRKATISKKQYISAAYRIILEEGLEELSIRRLGRELNCNTANLYRYFSGIEELSMYAALDSLQGYLHDVSELFRREPDIIRRYFGVWNCFCTHAFANAPLFDLLFFGERSSELYKVITDYYEMFPDELAKIDPGMQRVFLQGDFDYRDYLMLDEIVKQKRMDEFDAVVINNIAVNLFKGYFKTVLDLTMDRDGMELHKNKFLHSIEFVLQRHILPAG